VIAVYFGAVGIRRTRHAIARGLTADVAAGAAVVWVVRLFFRLSCR
jgi:spore maturation protein B